MIHPKPLSKDDSMNNIEQFTSITSLDNSQDYEEDKIEDVSEGNICTQ